MWLLGVDVMDLLSEDWFYVNASKEEIELENSYA
jgi:hypothetical protein